MTRYTVLSQVTPMHFPSIRIIKIKKYSTIKNNLTNFYFASRTKHQRESYHIAFALSLIKMQDHELITRVNDIDLVSPVAKAKRKLRNFHL